MHTDYQVPHTEITQWYNGAGRDSEAALYCKFSIHHGALIAYKSNVLYQCCCNFHVLCKTYYKQVFHVKFKQQVCNFSNLRNES